MALVLFVNQANVRVSVSTPPSGNGKTQADNEAGVDCGLCVGASVSGRLLSLIITEIYITTFVILLHTLHRGHTFPDTCITVGEWLRYQLKNGNTKTLELIST